MSERIVGIILEIELPRNQDGEIITHELVVPTLPRVGDYISSDKHVYSGAVKDISFWEEADGTLNIKARLGGNFD